VPEATGSAADTAALIELARVFQGRPTRDTLVLASVDGSTLGEVGTSRLIDELPSPGAVDGVLAVSDLGSRERDGSFVQAWSADSRRAGIGLQRTVSESIRLETDSTPAGSGTLGQFARLSFPIGIGAQAPLIAAGYDAVRISGSGELPPGGDGPVDQVDEDRIGTLGRATLRTLTALDRSGRAEHGPDSYLTAVSQVVPGWALTLLAGALLIPAVVAAVDALARARRRRIEVAPSLRWVGAWVAPFLAALAVAQVLALVGATPAPPPNPVPPDLLPVDAAAMGVLAGMLVAMALALFAGRLLAARPEPDRRLSSDGPGAAVAVGLVVAFTSLLVWIVDPIAGLLTVPAAHLWLLAALLGDRAQRRVRCLLLAAGGVPPLLVALYYLFALSLDPLHAVWYLVMLVDGHVVGFVSALAGCVMLGALCAAAELVLRTPAVRAEGARSDGPSVYGPGGLAGPGSLGGTEYALGR
jgi:hypothetical protein